MDNKKGQFSSIQWKGSSVGALLIIIGAIFLLMDKGIGLILILLGIFVAIIMSPAARSFFGS